MPLSIAIDIHHLDTAKTGKEWYTFNVLKELLIADPGNQYILYTKNPKPPFKLPQNARLRVIRAPSLIWHWAVLRDLKKNPPDFFWSPTSYIIPACAPSSLKTIITIHDLVAIKFPEYHNKKAILIESATLRKALKKTTHVFAVSQNTADDISKTFSITKSKISITPCAAARKFKALPPADSRKKLQYLDLPEKFILSVGTVEPRKNLVRLMKAFEKIEPENPDLHLVIAGGKGWKSQEIFKKAATNPKIHFLGYLEEDELIALYNLAQIFVFPSLYEGFGIPPLEAMQCGCPVITSNLSSLPEVVGKAALTIDPKNTAALAEAMNNLLKNQELRNELTISGPYQAKKFSWHSTAQGILATIKKLGLHEAENPLP